MDLPFTNFGKSIIAFYTYMFLLVLTNLLCYVSAEPVNVALGRIVTTKYTCGSFGEEMYNTLQDARRSLSERARQDCVDIRPNGDPKIPTHPEEAMVDGNMDTWWQSTSRYKTYYYGTELRHGSSRKLEAEIIIDLEQEFLAEEIIIYLGEALSPQKIAIWKSLDGQTYQEWIYGVTSLDLCQSFFGSSTNRLPSSLDGQICLFYEADDQEPGDTIPFDLKDVPEAMQEWQRIRFLKIEFFDMLFVFPFNQFSNTYNHYAVKELQVMAECPCNGQQTGCELNSQSGVYECVCGGNTKGRFCDVCDDKFNQFQFQQGVACQECNCFGHSDSCFYSSDVEENSESIDIDGNNRGGGVCLECRHNTNGVNCEKCTDLYYRPEDHVQTDNNVCIPCGCSPDGSAVNIATGLVDCVMNDDEVRTDGKVPGDCFCRLHVEGTKCDTCKAGYYNLDVSHDGGCIECSCFTPGTVEASTLCVGDDIGQCTCKANVEGRDCSECKDGFYGLTAEDPNGCRPCDCNIGGAIDHVCNKVTGQCLCRSDNIIGRICDSVQVGFFYPSPHAIFEEFEDSFGLVNIKSENQYSGFFGQGYVDAEEEATLSVLMSIVNNRDPSNQYIMIVRYRTPAGESTNAVIEIEVPSSESDPVSMTLPVCTETWCQVDSGAAVPFQLMSFPILISVTVTTGNVLLDKLVAMPVEYTTVESLLSITLPSGCSFIQNIMPLGEDEAAICENALFTVTMLQWGSPLPCDCDVTGSSNTICEDNGGQCYCRNGVLGRSCDTCAPDHYGFTSEGCTECNCDGSSSACDAVTGQCQCPDNTISRQCDLCLPAHWGWDRDLGCKACGCNEVGSAYPQCNEETGICTCKPGVTGDKCDECMENFYNLGSQGCSSCACDMRGSINAACNGTTGQCECKENTVGRQCNQCSVGTFGLHADNEEGCLNCICMGITESCSSANLKINMELFPLITTTESGSQARLILAANDGTASGAQINIETNEDGQTFALSTNFDNNASPLFWAMPSELYSNLLDLYGSSVTVQVKIVLVEGEIASDLQAVLLTSDGTKLTTNFGPLQNGFTTEVVITLRESGWQQEGSQSELTHGEFLKALSKVSHFLIPATSSSSVHTSSLTSLEFGRIGNTGVDVLTVEDCVCGEAYSGRSCQSCAEGYKRANQGDPQEYFGECVLCECNGHSSNCDEETGACIDCQHNTVGSSCEQCANGYYGDALGGTDTDCTACPCFLPRVSDAACTFNASGNDEIVCTNCNPGYEGNLCDQCSSSYYGNPQDDGGTCSPCQCNGNAESCDSVTGICIECGSNTEGDNCERCIAGFYGEATAQSCTECGCVESSSNSTVCDASSGQCPCHPGVGGRTCDQCLEGFWGYNNDEFIGCTECQCLLEGSAQSQCDGDTGQCTCKENTEGDSCDTCSENFFGLPEKPCEACACDAVGTVPDTICNSVSGMCSCQPGITGRQCDVCLPLHIGFSAEGCTECGSCQNALGESMQSVIDAASQYLQNSQVIFDVQDEDSRLQTIEIQLQETLERLGLTETDATTVTDFTRNITNLLTTLSNGFTSTDETVTNLQTDSSDLLERSRNKATEETNMNDNATILVTQLTTFEREANSGLQFIIQYNKSASELSERGSEVTTVIIDLTVQTAAVNKLLSDVQDIGRIDEIINTITGQGADSSTQLNSIGGLMENFNTISVRVDDLISNHSKVSFNVAVIDNTLDQALNFKNQAEELLGAFDTVVTSSEDRNSGLASTLVASQQVSQRTRSVYNGDAASVITGEDVLPFPSGVTNYESGSASLNTLLQAISGFVTNTEDTVARAEAHVEDLQTDSDALNSTYSTLPNIGKEAKDAIDNYRTVILDLNNSLIMANTARELIAEVQQNISGDSLEERRVEYDEEKTRSETLRDEMVQLDLQSQVLQNDIALAQERINNEVSDWLILDEKLTNMTSEAEILTNLLQGNSLMETINEAVEKVKAAETATDLVLTSVQGQSDILDQREAELEITMNQIQETKDLDTVVRDKLNNHQYDFANFMSNITEANGNTAEFLATATSISNKIASLEEKLARAESLLTHLRQPMAFDENVNIEVENPDVDSAHTYDYVSMNVKRATGFTDGNIFFTENDQNDDELEIGLTESKVFFEFHTGSDTIRVTNPAVVCDDCWAEVHASRIGNVGYLSVTNIATGEVTSYDSTGETVSTSSSITLNTPLYIGSLPQDTTITKVVNKEFQGCLNEMQFQNQAINLWSAAVASNQQPGCCQAPPSVPEGTTINGASFTGYGFIYLQAPETQFPAFESVSLEFRTFSLEGSLFLTSSADSNTSLSASLSGGAVSFHILLNGVSNELITDKTYNNGQWVSFTASLNENQFEISVGFVGEFDPEVRNLTLAEVDLSALENQNIIVGAPINPFKEGVTLDEGKALLLEDVNDKYFTGCLRNVDLDISSFGPAARLSMTSDALIQSGVNPNECPENVYNGVSFLTSTSYVRMSASAEVQQLASLEMKVITRETHAILVYITASTPTRSLYVALFGGNVMVYYSQEAAAVLVSTGEFISDGQEHTIRIDALTSRVSLQVDGSVFEESSQTLSTQYLSFASNVELYLGGIPEDISLSNRPVTKSLIGGISSFSINENLITLTQTAFETYGGISLEGIAKYSDDVVPTPDACGTKSAPSLLPLDDAARFEGTRSFDWATGGEFSNQLRSGFTMTITFASYKADGVLFYVADSLVTPNHYLTIYMMDGILYLKMRTSLGEERTASSSASYNDAQQHELSITRTNDHVGLTMNSGPDFGSTGASSSTVSTLEIPPGVRIYLGGTGNYDLSATPLPESLKAKVQLVLFAGAIFSASIDDSEDPKILDFTQMDRNVFPQVPENVVYGVSLSGQASYLQLDMQTTTPNQDVIIGIRITTTTQSALLFVLYETSSKFIAVNYDQNKIVLHLSESYEGITDMTSLTAYVFPGTSVLCDGNAHFLNFQFSSNKLTTTVDSLTSDINIPISHAIQPMTDAFFLVGGVTDEAASALSDKFTTTSMEGCVESISFTANGNDAEIYDPTKYGNSSAGLSYGCTN